MAQHSLSHVEKHLEKSPVQYMQWRFGTGDGTDRFGVISACAVSALCCFFSFCDGCTSIKRKLERIHAWDTYWPLD